MKILTVAGVSLREAFFRKIQVNLLLFGFMLVAASYALSLLTLGEQHRIIADLGLTAMAFVGTLLAAFLGAGLVAGDVERRVVLAIVAKPLGRWEYVFGRYLGFGAALVLNMAAMGLLLAVLLASVGGAPSVSAVLLGAVAMLCVQVLVVSAVAVLFSSFTTVTLAGIFSFAVAIAGHLTNEMMALWKGGGDWLPRLLWLGLPNLGALSLNEAVIYRTPLSPSAFLPALYGLVYAAACLFLAALIFDRRDLR